MGAKTWMLVYSNGPVNEILKAKPTLDREASASLVKELFRSYSLQPSQDGTLSFTCPPAKKIVVGCFPGVSIVAAGEFGIDYPSKLPQKFLDFGRGETIYLHAMHSVVDWFAFAVWKNGELQRSLSLSPDSGILENIGDKLQFEKPYWAGDYPAVDPDDENDTYPLPFHPLELGEAALLDFFGYQLEGVIDPANLEPEDITLMCFKRSKAWWKWW